MFLAPQFFLGGERPRIFGVMWQSFAVIGRGSSEITRWKKTSRAKQKTSRYTYGRPNKWCDCLSTISHISLEVHGRARRETARRHKSEYKVNLARLFEIPFATTPPGKWSRKLYHRTIVEYGIASPYNEMNAHLGSINICAYRGLPFYSRPFWRMPVRKAVLDCLCFSFFLFNE